METALKKQTIARLDRIIGELNSNIIEIQDISRELRDADWHPSQKTPLNNTITHASPMLGQPNINMENPAEYETNPGIYILRNEQQTYSDGSTDHQALVVGNQVGHITDGGLNETLILSGNMRISVMPLDSKKTE